MKNLTLSEADRDLIRSLIVAEPSLVLEDDDVMRRLVGDTANGGLGLEVLPRLVAVRPDLV